MRRKSGSWGELRLRRVIYAPRSSISAINVVNLTCMSKIRHTGRMPAILPNCPPRRGFPGEVGTRIREARLRRGLQQREVASWANLDQPTLSKYEAGIHPPSLRRLWGIARALALPVDCLLPPLVFQDENDRELYSFFRVLWFESLAVRTAATQVLRGLLKLKGGADASGR